MDHVINVLIICNCVMAIGRMVIVRGEFQEDTPQKMHLQIGPIWIHLNNTQRCIYKSNFDQNVTDLKMTCDLNTSRDTSLNI